MSAPSGSPRAPRTFGELLVRPPFYAPGVFELDAFAAHTLLQLSRQPHRYGFAFSALGSAPHLIEFEAGAEFDSLMRGDGFDYGDAVRAATRSVFEMLERVWSALVPRQALRRGSEQELRGAALDPRSFALLCADELSATRGRFVPYRSDLPLDWITAQRLARGAPMAEVLVPALFVFPGFGARFPAQRFVPMLSTGLAAATRYDDALMRAICEVVERDAFAIAWLFGLPPPRIEQAAGLLPAEAAETMQALQADGFAVDFFDLTRDIDLPVVLAAVRSRAVPDAGIALGLGCHPAGGEALSKSLREAMLSLANAWDFPAGTGLARKGDAPARPPRGVEVLASFLGSTEVSRRLSTGAGDDAAATRMPEFLLRAVDAVAAAGHDIYVCDLTPHVLDEERSFVLIRALIPGLQPHLYESGCWRLASPRLLEVARALGRGGQALTPADVQQVLNPFAWHLADG